MAFKILKEEWVRPVGGVLFDMDGVVLDTEKLYGRFWVESANALGWPLKWEHYLGLRSLDARRGQLHLEKCLGKGVSYEKIRDERILRMDAWVQEHGVEPKKGVGELLDYLQQEKLPCAITSSSPPERIRDYLTPLGLAGRFCALCSGCQVAHSKPEPDIYLEGAGAIGIAPESCLAVEDSPAGILSAYRAGCLPVIVPDQDQPDQQTLRLCFARADSLTDVQDLLEAVKGRAGNGRVFRQPSI